MSSTLVKLILLAEEHKELSGRFKWQFQVHEVSDELAGSVKDDILAKHFRDSHGLVLLVGSFCLSLLRLSS